MTDRELLEQAQQAVTIAKGLHEKIADEVPQLRRGLVWCRTCRREQKVDAADCLRRGWPKCCGYTMTIDHPDTWTTDGVEHPITDILNKAIRAIEARAEQEGGDAR